MVLFFIVHTTYAQQNTPLRRPISSNQPMWLIHIDTWNYADPQKIIDLIPADIRPYVVMNISLSISHDAATSQFKVAEYGYEIAKSWIRTCAQNQMWVMIQPSSGGFTQFSDFDLSVYEEFYKQYPNFIGFNYAEQFWGYDDATDPLSAKWSDRMAHFANLLKLSNKYGGYLSVSWCGTEWSPSINPIGMMKRNPSFAAACRNYTENYILSDKYTTQSYQSDMESICLGAYLSGYSGNYGIRYDDTGWTNSNGVHEGFTMATAGAPHFEHMMLNGQTVIDGPELIWTQCFQETNRIDIADGYKARNWKTFPQFDNTSIDIFRKVLDGTIRIPTRKEVINRAKLVIINNVQTGSPDDIYSSPQTMFEGLYRMDGDGNLKDNKSFFKKTGRYPTIPTVFQLDDSDAQSFNIKVNKSNYASRWPSIASKQTEFNTLFPEEYTGDLFVARNENGWVTYNPYKAVVPQTASASVPFKYNSCEKMELVYSQYTSGIIKEFSNKVNFYLTNYNEKDASLKTDIIKIYGSTTEPTYTYEDRASHLASVVTKNWTAGVLTLTIQHNGPLDLTVNCAGNGTQRLTDYTDAALVVPNKPSVYLGARQNEAEHFDYKNINSITTGGQNGSIRNYQGQGYLDFGTNAAASIKDVIKALRKGTYQLNIRYAAPNSAITNIDLYVNGTKVATPIFSETNDASTWAIVSQNIELNEGDNEIKLQANSSGSYVIYFDNITFSQNENNGIYNFTDDVVTTTATTPPANLITIKSGSAGVVSHTDANSNITNAFKAYSVGATNGTGVADLNMFPTDATDYSVTWKEYYTASGGKKGVLLRANGSSAYADGMKKGYLFIVLNNADGTITLQPYVAGTNGIAAKPTYTTTTLKVTPDQPAWFRASAIGDKLIFEFSADGVNWEGGTQTTYQDATYPLGSSELVWGLSSNNFSWVMDDIKFSTSSLAVSKFNMDGFTYVQDSGPSGSQMFSVSGSSLVGDITVEAHENYELSLTADGTYQPTLTLSQVNGTVANTTLFVRMKSGLSIGEKLGTITVKTTNAIESQVKLTGKVNQLPMFVKYDFTSDAATTSASTPPANNVTIGVANAATAGVVSYTDANNLTTNVIKPYGVGQKNATGVMDLNAFSKTGTDYSVTWKQYIGSGTNEYKVGVLLRGNTSKIGTASSGYVQGIMEGYLLLVYNSGTTTQFRIYRSTSSGLTTLVTTYPSFDPSPGQPVWYRASVSGSLSVSLKMEYSTDGVNWITGGSTVDSGTVHTTGATQIVWGLAVNNLDFYMDDISFNGLDESGGLGTEDFKPDSTKVLYSQYYNLLGQRLSSIDNLSGIIIIVKNFMSDGTIRTKKIYKKGNL
ncbi:glycoside hydrolase family 98 domain-containing protein [Flavobacterium eburneipallidum]|uniref:glycoside hydrolase family 98 domain-containing protein n=1 Tax=Flavobacterium eburneipallidum TaxID=3003263 RepID=UPI002482FFDC|nr:glycoside hydrolase family 98 domain-containing protein [Flavobacterium eburneipallidum]